MLLKALSSSFRYDADRAPIAIFTSMFLIDILVFSLQLPISVTAIYAFIAFFPKTMLTAWNHHHQHVPTFKNSWLNMALEVMYSFQTGVLPQGWVLHHNLGHHVNYMNGPKDESAWMSKSGRKMSEAEYTVKVTLMAYILIIRNCFRFDKRHGLRFLLGLILVGSVFFTFFSIDPSRAIILFFLPALGGLFGTVWYTYKHHAGLDTQIAEEASYNVVDPLYNKLTGNLGYHTAHHISCGIHWSKLPALHEKISHKIPGHLYKGPGFPFGIFQAIYNVLPLKPLEPVAMNGGKTKIALDPEP